MSLYIFIVLYILFGCMGYAVIHSYILGAYSRLSFLSPNVIYRNTKLNYIGAIAVSVLAFVISPIWYIIGFLCWLFTVGRK